MLRARERIGKHVGELETRSRRAPRPDRFAPAPDSSPAFRSDALRDRLSALDDVLERRIRDAARGVEDRIGEWVASRVKAAERRLELQSEVLEAALGEEVRAAEMERMRRELAGQVEVELERRLAEVAATLEALARSSASSAAVERMRGIEERLAARLEDGERRRDLQLAEAEAERDRQLATEVQATAARVQAAADSELEAVVADVRQGAEAAGVEVVERARRALEEAGLAAVDAAGERRAGELEERLRSSLEAAEGEALGRIASAAAEATARIASADAAQEREMRIRQRADRAREESERRVREAERRLADVMGRLGGTH